MADIRIDSHKLMFHVDRLNKWLKGEQFFPIYVEVGPSGACNHRCIFCALEYLGYEARYINTEMFKDRLEEMAKGGVKSLMFAGEGEPLLHKDIAELIDYAKGCGIDVAVTTNGVLINQRIGRQSLKALSWIRVSFNAATRENYARVHGTRPEDFDRVLSNLEQIVSMKRRYHYGCTIGVQLLMIPENYQETEKLANILKDIGVDYFTVKPFSKHPLSSHCLDESFDYGLMLSFQEALSRLSSADFRILFRDHTMMKLKEKDRGYDCCLGLPFWAYISSDGRVWACSAFLGKEEFLYGNLYEQTFSQIWEGPKRKKVLEMVEHELDVSECREVCRLDEINRYLWELKHPHPHVNFI
jgi:radical SAM protein with 4Fe4S-binding SPASM domain